MITRISKAIQSNHVLVKNVKNAAIVTINRPEKMNTLTPGMPKYNHQTQEHVDKFFGSIPADIELKFESDKEKSKL